MTVFIMPTKSLIKYRGKFPYKARSIGSAAIGYIVELMDGRRLWSAGPELAVIGMKGDFAALAADAVPMTRAQYAQLLRLAHITSALISKDERAAFADEAAAIKAEARAWGAPRSENSGFTVKVEGGNFAPFTTPEKTAPDIETAAAAAREFIAVIAARDTLHSDECAAALDFWTLGEISGDLSGPAARCDILINGGFYTISIAPARATIASLCEVEA